MEDLYNAFLGRYKSFTEIQEKAINTISSGANCIIIAPTGSGKTEAAMLPIFDTLSKVNRGAGLYTIYITPLKALNRDLMSRLKWMSELTGVTLGVRHGDTTVSERSRQSKKPPRILITTPESFQNLFLSPRLRDAMRCIKFVVIDELHELYPNKRGAQLSVALERLEELSPDFQRIGISATICDTEEASKFIFCGRKGEVISSSKAKQLSVDIIMPTMPKDINEDMEKAFNLDKPSTARIEFLANTIKNSKATIIFGNTRQVVESIGSKLIYLLGKEGRVRVGIHHSSLEKSERLEIEEHFKGGSVKGIIATSSLELGMDIGSVDLVVQYGSPRQAGRLIQRLGRGNHTEGRPSKGIIVVSSMLEALESAAIARDAIDLRLNSPKIERNAADVLLNQICAMSLEYGSIGKAKAFDILSRSAAFSDITHTTLDKALMFASEEMLIRLDGEKILRTGTGRKYFIKNVSVIPDSPRYIVKDVLSNRIISSLDEKFVYSYIEEGAAFITKGMPWRVISLEEGIIHVESCTDTGAAVPDWDGEDIPVTHEVATNTFAMMCGETGTQQLLSKELISNANSFREKQDAFFKLRPNSIIIEETDDFSVVYLPYGKQANELLSKMICSVARAEIGETVIARATPYAIIIDCTYLKRRPDIRKALQAIRNNMHANDINGIISRTEIFRYKFIHVAKLSGIIEKKTAITKSTATRLINFYKDSIIYEETLRDLYKNNLDLSTVSELLKELDGGRISISVVNTEGSPLYSEIVKSSMHRTELLSLNTREDEIESFIRKFEGKNAELICTYCGTIFREVADPRLQTAIKCPICKSNMVALYKEEYQNAVNKKLKSKALNPKERMIHKEMIKEAGLISAYGSRALVALMTYGIGQVAAARTLKMVRTDYKMFVADLIRAKKLFIRNSRFWRKSNMHKKR